MQAIVTRYLPAVGSKGSRIKASSAAGQITVPFDHSLNSETRHAQAAIALCKKLNWSGEMVSGEMPNGDTCHVFVNFKSISATRSTI